MEPWRITSVLQPVSVWQGISKKSQPSQDLLLIWASFQASFWGVRNLWNDPAAVQNSLVSSSSESCVWSHGSFFNSWAVVDPSPSMQLPQSAMKSSIFKNPLLKFHCMPVTVLATLLIITSATKNKRDTQDTQAYILMTPGERSGRRVK